MIINITIYKNIRLAITLLDWFIWPIWRRNHDITYQRRHIEVAWRHPDTENVQTESHVIKKQTDFYIWLLCFRLHFPSWWRNKDVASIYPENYKWREDPEYNEKYDRLCETEYFY